MTPVPVDSLEALLEKLTSGDHAAAEQVFREYEPYLRKVVRRQLPAELTAKFDSMDVVQSMYGDVLVAFREGGMRFRSVAQLRAYFEAGLGHMALRLTSWNQHGQFARFVNEVAPAFGGR